MRKILTLLTTAAVLLVGSPVTVVAQEPTAVSAPIDVGQLTISRRIVRGVDEAGQDVAGYLLISNGSVSEDELTAVTCDCAEAVEFHHIRRTPERVSMDSDPTWVVPAGGALSVRPGSDLHLMLIGYDPARATDGRVRMSLTFRDAGTVQADFALTGDSAAAWAAFD
jgi:copper(I)-binding protein